MLSAFVNCFKIAELRDRIILTLGLLVAARVGANIPLPGVDPRPLQDFFASQAGGASGNLVGLYNMFTGGAMAKGAIFALGIMPYISAQIIFQMIGSAVPSLARLQQEGEVGRQKITQYTRYMTVAICVIQAILLVLTLENPARLFPGFSGTIVIVDHLWFMLSSVIFMTAGTVTLMWIGEQITQRGIGNGISILITIGILADIPGAAQTAYRMFSTPLGTEGAARLGLPEGVLMILLFVAVTTGLVMLTQALRKIPVQYAKRVVGRKVYGGQTSFMPLRVNYSGVMPIIFASAILMFLQQIVSWAGVAFKANFLVEASSIFLGGFWYYFIFSALILIFSYVWVSIMFKPIQVADDLKKYGGYIPAIRPGEPTARYLDFVMTRLTAFGTLALIVIALFPSVLSQTQGIPYQLSQFFGGTGMLITVGVLLDLLRQVETFLLQRHYDGFLKKGRIKGRSVGATRQIVDKAGIKRANAALFMTLALFVTGLVAYIINVKVLS
ncbi:MAG: preprotein translocase subunit SecY [Opitutales bacterium]|nr:preprotein translocase subunit SecY [Opitutales bacterium]